MNIRRLAYLIGVLLLAGAALGGIGYPIKANDLYCGSPLIADRSYEEVIRPHVASLQGLKEAGEACDDARYIGRFVLEVIGFLGLVTIAIGRFAIRGPRDRK